MIKRDVETHAKKLSRQGRGYREHTKQLRSSKHLIARSALVTWTKLQRYFSVAAVQKNPTRGDNLKRLLATEATEPAAVMVM